MNTTDPIFHGAADVLPDDHPNAWVSLYCIRCAEMVHAFNNECMQAWFETYYGPLCFECFALSEYEDMPGPGSDLGHWRTTYDADEWDAD